MVDYYKNLVQKPKYEVRTEFDDVKGRQYPAMTFISNELVPRSKVYIEMDGGKALKRDPLLEQLSLSFYTSH